MSPHPTHQVASDVVSSRRCSPGFGIVQYPHRNASEPTCGRWGYSASSYLALCRPPTPSNTLRVPHIASSNAASSTSGASHTRIARSVAAGPLLSTSMSQGNLQPVFSSLRWKRKRSARITRQQRRRIIIRPEYQVKPSILAVGQVCVRGQLAFWRKASSRALCVRRK